MRVRILKLEAGDRPPFLSSADVERMPDDASLCVFHNVVTQGVIAGWWPTCLRATLQGRAYAQRAGMHIALGSNAFEVVDQGNGPELDVKLGESAVLVSLIPAPALMRRLVEPAERDRLVHPLLFSASYGRELRGYWLLRQLAAECYSANAVEVDDRGAMERVLGSLVAAQSAFEPFLRRCPGRQLQHRRELFARLQRVRAVFDTEFLGDTSTIRMAALASCSPAHFVRLYKHVFGETPHRALARAKLDRAMSLLERSPLTITEIACQLGFENRCAFARWIKTEAGQSASEIRSRLRQLPAESAAAAAATPTARRVGHA